MTGFPTRAPIELEERPREQQWLVDTLWGEQAVGIVGGEPKCGKSILALDLAVAVAAGVPCLRHFAPARPGPVLLFAAEDAGHLVRKRLQGIARAAGARFESSPPSGCASRPRPAGRLSPKPPSAAFSRPSPALERRSPNARSANAPQPGTRPSAPSCKGSSGRGASSATPRAATASSQARRTRRRRSTPPTAAALRRPRGSRIPVPPTSRASRRNRLPEPPPRRPGRRQAYAATVRQGGGQPLAGSLLQAMRHSASLPRPHAPAAIEQRDRPATRGVSAVSRQSLIFDPEKTGLGGKSTRQPLETIREIGGQIICETTPRLK